MGKLKNNRSQNTAFVAPLHCAGRILYKEARVNVTLHRPKQEFLFPNTRVYRKQNINKILYDN